MPSSADECCRTVLFSGDVQGVGFRYTTVRIARQYRVSGYVRNLRDGRVEVVAEGARAEVADFLADIERTMEGYIRDRQVMDSSTTGGYTGFSIRY